jgi:hypothetical protein
VNARRAVLLATFLLVAALARAEDAPDPIATAKEGEWVYQKIDSNYGGLKLTQFLYMWVSKVEGRKLTLGLQIMKDEKRGMMPPFFSPVDLDHREKPAPAKVSQEDVERDGKKLHCSKREETGVDSPAGKVTTTTWICSEVPVDGVLRIVSVDKDGKETSRTETTAWGREGGAEKPIE